MGSPAQQTSRLMNVVVTDVDDHAPTFRRQRNSVPVELEVREEIPLGSEIGQVAAIDDDEGENAVIDYAIIEGNDNRIFDIKRGVNNQGLLFINRRLDREENGIYFLTVKCFRPYERNLKSKKGTYNSAVSTKVFLSFIQLVILLLFSRIWMKSKSRLMYWMLMTMLQNLSLKTLHWAYVSMHQYTPRLPH